MEFKRVREEFLQAHLPSEVKSIIDFDTLKIEKESYIEDNLKKQFTDVLISAKLKDGGQGYVYTLLEHQSKPDHWMAFRIFKYMCAIWDNYLANHKKSKKLPIIYPIVVYNGTRRYNAPLSIFELCENLDLVKNIIGQYQLLDLNQVTDEEIKEHKWAGLLEYLMKSIYSRDLMNKLLAIKDQIKYLITIAPDEGTDYFKVSLYYATIKIEEDQQPQIVNMINNVLSDNKEKEETMVSLAQKWENQGMQKGMQLGIQEGMQLGRQEGVLEAKRQLAKKMLLKGMDALEVVELSGLTEIEILQLKADLNIK